MIPKRLFKQIEQIMAIPSVDVIVMKDHKIILTKRAISPYKGYWHLPGSIVQKNEKMIKAVERTAKHELGIKVKVIGFVNYYEMFSRSRHYISHLFIAMHTAGEIKLDYQSSQLLMAKPDQIPNHTMAVHKRMILDAREKGSFPL